MKGKFTKILEICNEHSTGMPKDVVKWRRDVEEWIVSKEGAHAFLQICERQGMEYPFNARGLFKKIYKEIKK